MVRTRVAPSPTGYPHIGTIYQALFDYAYAKKHGGKFIVRIEDTDRTRFVEGSEEVIFSSLDWFGLQEDESARRGGDYGPYRQSERLPIYHKYAQELLDKDLAYFAYYPKKDAGVKKDYSKQATSNAVVGDHKEVTSNVTNDKTAEVSDREPASIAEMIDSGDWILRMRVPKDNKITVKDEIRGDIVFEPEQVTEQVLLKSDGYPTYHLAAIVDDHLMQISHILRAEEWLSSLPKHVLLYKYFGWDMPPIYHTATLRNPDKSKLSKRHGHTNVHWFKEEGYLPEAILNYLALLGWSHPEEKEIFSLEEFIKVFDLHDIRPIAPIFDTTKLTWMNQQYIQMKSDEELMQLISDFYPDVSTLDKSTFRALMPLVKTRMSTLKEFETLTQVFFADPVYKDITDKEKEIAADLKKSMHRLQDWENTAIFTAMKEQMTQAGVKMPVLYKIFTGKERGLPLPQVLEILGKSRTLAILDKTAVS
jgi:glutamyl-tRNA synthetase